jgi:hypothetical protein
MFHARLILILVLCTLYTMQDTAPDYAHNYIEKNLGFIVLSRHINLGKTTENFEMGINIAVHKIDMYKNTLAMLEANVAKINAWEIWGDNSTVFNPLKALRAGILLKKKLISFRLESLSKYIDPESTVDTTNLHICKLDLPPVDPAYLEATVLDLQKTIQDQNGKITAEQMGTAEGKNSFNALIYWLHRYESTMDNLLNMLTERHIFLDNLSSHLIPEKIPILIESQKCYSSSALESLDVQTCYRTKTGLYCELLIITQSETEKASLYTAVNYRGIQLELPTVQHQLIQTEDTTWKTMWCPHDNFAATDIDEFNMCMFNNFDAKCIDVLHKKDIDPILQHCNFTYIKPDSIVRLPEGILLQGQLNYIKELENESKKTINVVKNELPLVITTNSWLEINIDSREIILKPTKVFTNHSINFPWMNSTQIDKLVYNTKLRNLVTSIDAGEWIDIVMGFILLIIAPAVLYVYKSCCGSNQININCCKRPPLPRNPRKENYKLNKKVLIDDIATAM